MNDAAQRRALILQAADRLLRHYGPHKTTVADVAREAGVGVGSVYLEFPSKDAIVEELARARHRDVLAAMRAAATDPGKTFRERLACAFDARLAAHLTLADEGAHACDLVHCSSTSPAGKAVPAAPPPIPGVKTALQSYWEEELGLVTELLRRGTEAGDLEVADPEAMARAVLRAYAGFAPPWVAGRDREEVLRSIACMHDLVLHGVARRSPKKPRNGAEPAPSPPRTPDEPAAPPEAARGRRRRTP